MSKTEDERNSAGKVLDLLDALSGCAVNGASNGALAKGLELSPSTITTLMKTVIGKGWARKDDVTGLFHPTPRMARVFGRVLADLDKAEANIRDLKTSFTRNY
jgi:DNA-binding IclR family transcriptional regulator